MNTVAIAGVGLMGGSFALALRKAGFDGEILGVSSPASLDRALARSVIDAGATLADAVSRADLVYLALPINRIIEILPALNAHVQDSALVTDAGSTKRKIMEAGAASITGCLFLGGHPLAGKEVRGVQFACAELFEGRAYVVTPGSERDLQAPRVMEFLEWLRRMGAVPLVMDAAEHDRTVAYTSHLPQLASTALACFLSSQGESAKRIFGPGLLDSTRLAQSTFDIWADILKTNRGDIDQALGGFIDVLERMRDALGSRELERSFDLASKFAREIRLQPQDSAEFAEF